MPWIDKWYSEVDARKRLAQYYAVGAIVFLIIGFAVSGFIGLARSANRTKCAGNLHKQALAFSLYAQDHEGQYPPADTWAKDLIPYLDSASVFICPSDKGAGRLVRKTKHRSYLAILSYWYIPPQGDTQQDATSVPITGDLMYTNLMGNHEGGGNVAYMDGHIAWCTIRHWGSQGLPTVVKHRKKHKR